MNRLPFILSAIALAVLAGCATESGVTSAPAPAAAAPAQPTYVVVPAGAIVVPQAAAVAPVPVALRAGFGRIESILAVPSAAAGGTGKPHSRVVMKMDDGSTQYFDTQATGMAVGDRIEITTNGTMRHPA
jgi:hypothetical protein